MAGQAPEKGAFLLGGDAGNGRPGNGPAMARRASWWGDWTVGQWRVRARGAKAMADRVYIMHVIVIMIGARVRGENTLTIIIHHHDDTGSPPPF